MEKGCGKVIQTSQFNVRFHEPYIIQLIFDRPFIMNFLRRISLFSTTIAGTMGIVSLAAAQDNLLSDVGIAIGGIATISPVYEGSDDYKVRGVPIAYPTFGNRNGAASRLFFRGIDDIRYAVFQDSSFSLGPVVGYRTGRDAGDAPELRGLNNPDGGAVLGAFAQYSFYGGAFADIALSKQVSGLTDSGFLVEFGAGYDFDITDRLSSRIYAAGTYASEDYMDQYFSITPAQAAASAPFAGYMAFDAGAGIKNVELNASLRFDATERFSVRGLVGYSRIIGDAADSPITISDNQFRGGLGFTVKF